MVAGDRSCGNLYGNDWSAKVLITYDMKNKNGHSMAVSVCRLHSNYFNQLIIILCLCKYDMYNYVIYNKMYVNLVKMSTSNR